MFGSENLVSVNSLRIWKPWKYSSRARLNPEFEKAGILDEPAVMIGSLRRPADVLVDDISNRLDKMALDIKVINGLGPEHYSDALVGGLQAADKYRIRAMEFQDTAALCARQGVKYEPLVFTAQGGMQANAEAIIGSIAQSIAKVEGTEPGVVKAAIIADLSRTLVRAASRALSRRTPRNEANGGFGRVLDEYATLEP